MMVMSKNRGKRIGRELVQKPFPGSTRDSEDQAGGVGYEFFPKSISDAWVLV